MPSLPCCTHAHRFFLQSEDGERAEAYLKAGPLALQPEHGDALADLSVALAMQGQDRLQEAVETLERAEALGAAGESFTRRRCVFFCGLGKIGRMCRVPEDAGRWKRV